jgi:small-conductance mechanosensitive channel
MSLCRTKCLPVLWWIHFLFLLPVTLLAQDEADVQKDSVEVQSQGLNILEIPEESERIGKRIFKLKEVLEKSSEIARIDSALVGFSEEIQKRYDTTPLNLEELSARDLKVKMVEWSNFKSTLTSYRSNTKDRSEEISKITNELFAEINIWENTKEEIESRNDETDIFDGIDGILNTLEETMSLAHARLDSVFVTQKNVTNLVLIVDEQLARIERGQKVKQRDYFAIDSPPIWDLDKSIGVVLESLPEKELSTYELIWIGLKENKLQLSEFIKLNVRTFGIQLGFLLLLCIFLFVAKSQWKVDVSDLTSPAEIRARVTLDNPILVTISTGLLLSVFFYEEMVPAFTEINIFLILLGTALLLPKLTTSRLRPFLLLIFVDYILFTFEAFLGPKAELVRWLLILDSLILFYALWLGRRVILSEPEAFGKVAKVFKPVSSVYMFILILGVFGNAIGMVGLSAFLNRAVLVSTSLGMVVFLSVVILASLLILVFNLRKNWNIHTLDAMVKATNQRIKPLLQWIGLISWIFFTIEGFGLLGTLSSWWEEILMIKWIVGEMTISLGGILAFVGIIIVTFVIAKVAGAIFQDEWMVNVLPRGMGPAISLVLRIVVVTLGLYAGLSAAGVDLSKLGFIVGALGVGIGFGLQNVVLNFVSGLILAFERPINLGDTIEVDMEKGVVTNIGVRSSNIRTYSGSEVIIPNGDLISKKVVNWTLSNRERRSRIQMKTAPDADPEKVIELFNSIASEHPATRQNPAPKSYFYGYGPDGNLNFALMYWTTFSDTLRTDSEISLKIFNALKRENIQAPAPVRRIINSSDKE